MAKRIITSLLLSDKRKGLFFMEVILQPIAMVVPNSQGIYAPSRIKTERTITQDDFDMYRPHEILVSFEADGISNPQLMTAYGFGMDCWYLVEGN